MKKKITFRKIINDIHLWLGIGSGIILFIVCLTGTILAFEQEIKSVLNKSTYKIDEKAEKKSIYDIKNEIEKSGQYNVAEFIIIQNDYTALVTENEPKGIKAHDDHEDDHGPSRINLHINPFN